MRRLAAGAGAAGAQAGRHPAGVSAGAAAGRADRADRRQRSTCRSARSRSQGHFLRSRLPGSDVPVYLVEQADYYDRPQLYREDGEDYKDNCERFTFFCRAVLEAIPLLDLRRRPGPLPRLVRGPDPRVSQDAVRRARRRSSALASVLTIHNLAYQGNFWHWDMALTGLDWKYFNWRQMEFYGNLSFLKTGIVFADMLTTVSPPTPGDPVGRRWAAGSRASLQHRRDDLVGHHQRRRLRRVESGDRPLSRAPTATASTNFAAGKAACKADLQRRLGLPERPDVPLLAAVGRLVDQKGFDLIARVMRQWAAQVDAQWVILGTGEPQVSRGARRRWPRSIPQKVAVRLEFSDELAHRIEAGADMFVMPSQYEPCGLNQLYSLKYGTVPVVRATGGLVDTVVDANEQTLADGTATGFSFEDYTSLELAEALERACRAYRRHGRVDAAGRDGHAAGLVVAAQRRAVRRAVRADAGSRDAARRVS